MECAILLSLKKEGNSDAATWMNLEEYYGKIELSQLQKDKYCMSPLIRDF